MDAEDARHRGDDVAAVADHDGVLVEHPVELGAEAVVVDRRGVGLDLGAVLVPPRRLGRAQALEPRRAAVAAALSTPSGERAEHGGAVADDRGVRDAVPAELARVAVDVDQLARAEPAVAEPEVERRPDHADDVGLVERRAARVLEEELVAGRQRAAAGAVQEHGQPAVLGERGELGRGAVPPDAAARRRRRAARRALRRLGGRHELARVAERARGDRDGRGATGSGVAVGEEDVRRQLEVDRPARRRERLPERDRHVLRDAVGATGRPPPTS